MNQISLMNCKFLKVHTFKYHLVNINDYISNYISIIYILLYLKPNLNSLKNKKIIHYVWFLIPFAKPNSTQKILQAN